jgi:hypothetical protein
MGSSRVIFSLNRCLSSSSAKYRIARVDPEKAILNELHDFKPAISIAKDDVKSWTVREVNDTEDPDIMLLSSWKKALMPFLGLTTPLPMVFALWYSFAQSRILCKHSENLWSKDWTVFIGLPLVALDLLLVRESCLPSNIQSSKHLLTSEALITLPTILVSIKTLMARHRPRLQLSGDNVPAVDILVTSCNEAIEVIQDTLLAALAIDYPQNKYRVIVADDGSSRELEAWVNQLNRPNLHYTTRSIRSGFKAGNLNHAVEQAETLPGGPSDFIAALDADMIVEKRWLRSIVAHIVLDGNLGLVCPPQVRTIFWDEKASVLKKTTAKS